MSWSTRAPTSRRPKRSRARPVISGSGLSRFSRVATLTNNAAIRPHKPFIETTDADWELIRSVVLDGALYLTRALIEPMVKDRYGRILFFVGEDRKSVV